MIRAYCLWVPDVEKCASHISVLSKWDICWVIERRRTDDTSPVIGQARLQLSGDGNASQGQGFPFVPNYVVTLNMSETKHISSQLLRYLPINRQTRFDIG